MLYPSIDSLKRKIDSKYTLVAVASKRAREMQENNDCMLDTTVSKKAVGKALEEIADGLLHLQYDEEKDNLYL
ncbi:MAG TPA: DNA-directed RNA polymerase subunit omega [Bacillus bacterium]|nr:DNA-directed RNA polymerase subunit omega [Bacillus sp. (in: firmicutes)]